MKNCNLVIISGIIMDDLKVMEGKFGPMGSIKLMITETKKTAQGFNDKKCLIMLSLLGKLAQKAQSLQLHKGHEIFVKGKLILDEWTKPDGTKGFMHKIQVEDLYDVTGRLEFDNDEHR